MRCRIDALSYRYVVVMVWSAHGIDALWYRYVMVSNPYDSPDWDHCGLVTGSDRQWMRWVHGRYALGHVDHGIEIIYQGQRNR